MVIVYHFFSKFIENSTAPIDFYWAEEFMRKNIGNLRDITEFLNSILEKLENHYQNEAENKRRELKNNWMSIPGSHMEMT